jgi:hypothetical protein
MRSGGKGMWGRGPALYKHNYLTTKKNIKNFFVGSESGQIQNVKLLQNKVSNRTQHHPPPSPSHTLSVWCIYCTLTKGRGEEGEVNQREG